MSRVDFYVFFQSNKFPAKIHELETFERRKEETDQKYLLNKLGILHVQANEAQRTKPKGERYLFGDGLYYLEKHRFVGS